MFNVSHFILSLGLLKTFLFIAEFGNSRAMYFPEYRGPESFCSERVALLNEGTDESCKSEVDLFVNRLDSVESAIPYDYARFDFCQADEDSSPAENLGQVVFGDRIQPSPYKFTFKKDEGCQKVCTKSYKVDQKDDNKEDKAKLNLLKKAVLFNYQHHWIIDNMPVTWCYEVQTDLEDVNDQSRYCSPGFPVGCFVDSNGKRRDACVIDQRYGGANRYYIFNHVNIYLEYHPVVKEGETEEVSVSRLVRARIVPFSIKQTMKDGKIKSCTPSLEGEGNGFFIPGGSSDAGDVTDISITYSYNVSFTKNVTVFWASRWDYLLDSMPHSRINWFSIFNSLVMVVFLTGAVAVIVRRVFKEECRTKVEYSMWKFVEGDVFRPPKSSMLLSVFLGSGAQVIIVTLFFLCLAGPGIISPVNRGSLETTLIILCSCTGIVAGYVSTNVYKNMGGKYLQANVLLTSVLVPGIIFFQFFVNNLIYWGFGSSAAVPFSTILILLSLWFVVYIPLVFIGSFVAIKQKGIDVPCATNEMPRSIPKRKFLTSLIRVMIGGILPFGCIYIQLFFIFSGIWAHQLYFMYGFLFFVVLLLVVNLAEVTIVLCYFQLKSEDHRLWWRSFLIGGSTAVYFFLYSLHYLWTRLELHPAASIYLYISYSFVMAFLLFLFSGTVGFFSCLFFVWKIHGGIETVYSLGKNRQDTLL